MKKHHLSKAITLKINRKTRIFLPDVLLSTVSGGSIGFAAFGALRAPARYAGCGRKKMKPFIFFLRRRRRTKYSTLWKYL
jgi:hypothetical protein